MRTILPFPFLTTCRDGLLGLALLASLPATAADIPGIITYQGRLTSHGTNFTGTGKFRFALVQPGFLSATLWSHDGQVPPKSNLSIPVADGIFTVALGDTTVPGMAGVIPVDAFDHADVRLRIWVDDSVSGLALLAPDQRLTTVGYAMRAANGLNGAITGDQIATGTITGTNIMQNSVTSGDIADVLTLQTLNLGGISWDGTLNLFAKPTGGGGGFVNPNGEPRGVLVGDALGSQFDLLFTNGLIGASMISRGTGGRLLLKDSVGNDTTVELGGGGLNGGFLTLRNTDGLSRAFLQGGGVHDGGELQLRDSTGANRLRLYGNAPGYIIDTPSAGGMDLYDLNGRRRLALRGEDGTIHLPQESGDEGVYLSGQWAGANSGGVLRLRQGNGGGSGLFLRGQTSASSGGQVDIYDAQNDRRIFLQGSSATVELFDNAGSLRTFRATGDSGELVALSRVGVANSVDASVLKASLGLDSNGGLIRTRDENDATTTFLGAVTDGGFVSVYANGTETIRLTGAETAGTGAQIQLKQANGNATVEVDAEYGANGGGILRLLRNNGANTITLQADDANGKGRITTQILQITGGSDLSERFDIDSSGAPEPGMVVCIDPAQPGRLITSSKSFDKTVAGVISGAGGVDPGMIMGQAGTAADGQHPVALTGRVYCRADARFGPIEPGDLLTTSDTPGHAMKAADAARSHGAILGKAMSRLESGRGLVLVLVNLQ